MRNAGFHVVVMFASRMIAGIGQCHVPKQLPNIDPRRSFTWATQAGTCGGNLGWRVAVTRGWRSAG